MALLNILSPRYRVETSNNEALRGGKVFLYEPGTTTFITSYRDSGLVVEHQNPVRLSGSGRANIWISRNCDMYITDRTGAPDEFGNIIVEELSANPDALGADEAGGLIANGSFEIDTDANNVPDGWVLVSESGSTNALDNTQSTDGSQSFRFTSAGSGGGSLTTENFFPVNDVDPLRVNFDLRSTIATVRNIVRVEWFDASQVSISNTDIYDSTANPTTFTSQNLQAVPPANARFAKLRLIGCDSSVAVVGSTFYDRVSAFYPALVTGVFDNITIQDNEIISTNTNGNIDILPNGVGDVQIGNASQANILVDADGEVVLDRANGDERLRTTTTGALTSGTVCDLANSADTNTLFVARNSSGGIRFRVATGGDAFIDQTDSVNGGIQEIWASFARSAEVSLFHNNGSMARTATAANGGFQVNNTVTGGGFERALTTSDIGSQDLIALATNTLSRNLSDAAVDDPDLTISSIPTGVYKVDAFIKWEGVVGVFLRYAFSLTGATGLNQALHTYAVSAGSGEVAIEGGFITLTTVVVLGPNPTNPNTSQGIRIEGTVHFNATGTIAFAWGQSVSSGLSIDRLPLSYLQLSRLGDTF